METSPNRRPEGRAGSPVAPVMQSYIQSVASDWRPGTIYDTCPECSHKRKKKKSRCLSVTVQDDRAIFYCHNCEIRGVVFRNGEVRLSQAEQVERQKIADAELWRDTDRRIGYARQIWDAAIPAAGTPVERYLWHRGFDLGEIPLTLRYARLKHPGTRETYDVMVAAVGYGAVPDAVHRTFLASGGNGKARLPDDFDAKLSLGPVRGRPIRLDGVIDAEAAVGSLAIADTVGHSMRSAC
jgi:putative DNA primase/helicase